MINKILSVIIPCYNAEKYLHKCLTSLIGGGTLDRLDVIIVDDGSTDETYNIAMQFSAQHPSSIRCLHKENGGHGSCINVATKIAVGKYSKILDADDWFISSNIPAFLDFLDTVQTDIVLTDFDTVDMSTGQKRRFATNQAWVGTEYSVRDFLSFGPRAYVCCTFHGITFRTKFYQDTAITLSEKVFYEDQEYATLPFLSAKCIIASGLCLYQYLIGNAEQSVSDINQVKRLPDQRIVLSKLFQAYQSVALDYDTIRNYLCYKVSLAIVAYYSVCLLKNPDRHTGRKNAVQLRQVVQGFDVELKQRTDKQYYLMRLLNFLHISPLILFHIKRSPLYRLAYKFTHC